MELDTAASHTWTISKSISTSISKQSVGTLPPPSHSSPPVRVNTVCQYIQSLLANIDTLNGLQYLYFEMDIEGTLYESGASVAFLGLQRFCDQRVIRLEYPDLCLSKTRAWGSDWW